MQCVECQVRSQSSIVIFAPFNTVFLSLCGEEYANQYRQSKPCLLIRSLGSQQRLQARPTDQTSSLNCLYNRLPLSAERRTWGLGLQCAVAAWNFTITLMFFFFNFLCVVCNLLRFHGLQLRTWNWPVINRVQLYVYLRYNINKCKFQMSRVFVNWF